MLCLIITMRSSCASVFIALTKADFGLVKIGFQMTIEANWAISLQCLVIGLKISCLFFQPSYM